MGDGKKQLLIIDTDCGVDDALAIALAVQHADVLALTCCHGNVSVDLVWKNVFRVLQYASKDIPVYIGCSRPLAQEPVTDLDFHGRDGFGEVAKDFPYDAEKKKPCDEAAAVALVRLSKQYQGQITLVALGPLSNLALAQRLDDNFSSRLKNVIFMGGNVTGLGNIDVASEFNFHCDPEAANVVLHEFTCPLVCVPWEPCFTCCVPWKMYHTFCKINTKWGKFFASVTKLTSEWVEKAGLEGFFPCDLYAMVFVLRPQVASCREKKHVAVELQGNVTRGEMVVERRSSSERLPNVDLVVEFNSKFLFGYIEQFLKTA